MTTALRPDASPQALTDVQLSAWRSFLRAHAQLTRTLESELMAAQDLPLPSYEVLLHLAEAPSRRLRMTELADRVLLSRSGLTRLVDRLERDRLVERASCPNDARGTHAVLTDAGLARLREAAPTHLEGVAKHVMERLTLAEIGQLKALMDKLLVDGQEHVGSCGAGL
jgi:DNA-binding MarR family transcriptional regulator